MFMHMLKATGRLDFEMVMEEKLEEIKRLRALLLEGSQLSFWLKPFHSKPCDCPVCKQIEGWRASVNKELQV